jgi:hypothetical protein
MGYCGFVWHNEALMWWDFVADDGELMVEWFWACSAQN